MTLKADYNNALNMASRKRTATTTLTKFLVKQRKKLDDNLARVDCEVVSASPKHALTFLIVGDSISASRSVCLLANLGDLQGVDAIFNEGVDTSCVGSKNSNRLSDR